MSRVQWLAKATKDYLQLTYGISVFMDIDDLLSISQESINEGIEQSCSILLFLHDETMTVLKVCSLLS